MIFDEKEIILKNGKKAILRSPNSRDACDMLNYLRTCAAETEFLIRYPDEIVLTTEQESEYLENISASPYRVSVCCFINGEIAANCSLYMNSTSKMRHRASFGIAVIKKYWHIGIAKALIAELEAICAECGVIWLELEVFAANQRALALYESCGFVKIGERPEAAILRSGESLCEFLMTKRL